MNLATELPQNERENDLKNKTVAAFGLTFQGTSHKISQPPAPCQDYHGMRWMEEEGVFLAAIADGVGSCRLSHWGSYTAVNAALDSVEAALKRMSNGAKMKLQANAPEFRKRMKEVMVEAFRSAQSAVEHLADTAEPPQPVFFFQSTLTLAIYDGECLYHGHAGDDGIVAQLPDGTVEMATRRMKGEEASSVYPLQSGESCWSFGLVPKVSGFIMATDGVLDAFVQSHTDYFGIYYFNGICYSFMEPAMTALARKHPDAAKQAREQYRSYMQSAEYIGSVTDDLTIVAVVSPSLMAVSQKPDFSQEVWNTIAQESLAAKRKALNHRHRQPAENAAVPEIPPVMQQSAEPDACWLPVEQQTSPARKIFHPQKAQCRQPALISILFAVIVILLILLGISGKLLLNYYEKEKVHQQLEPEYHALAEEHTALQQNYCQIEQTLQENIDALTRELAAREKELEAAKATISALQQRNTEKADHGIGQRQTTASPGVTNTIPGTVQQAQTADAP